MTFTLGGCATKLGPSGNVVLNLELHKVCANPKKELSSCEKGDFPSYCSQVLAYRESSNCQGFLYIVEWSLHYSIYHLEAIVLVIWGNTNKSEVNQTGYGAGFLSVPLFYSTEELFGKVSHRMTTMCQTMRISMT